MPDPEPIPKTSELEALLTSKEASAVLDSIFGFAPSGVVIASDPDGKILRVSNFAAREIGRSLRDLEGKPLGQVMELVPAYDEVGRLIPPSQRPLSRALLGETVTGFEIWVDAANGERAPALISAAPIHNWCGERIGAISSIADLRPYKALEQCLRDALVQRETLYRELTHRVKNHLQIMSALVSLEARNPAISAKDLADQVKGQLQTLAAVYKGMERAEGGDRIEARAFVEAVCRPYATDGVSIDAMMPPDLTLASDQAGAVGMLVNEAVCNCKKHAFPGHRGHVRVSFRRLELGGLRIEVADDGIGWRGVDPSRASHGLDLMRLFAQQLNCGLQLGDSPGGGVLVAVEMPEAVE